MKPNKNCMYQGTKRFDRDQLEFMVDVILCAAVDCIEAGLPQSPNKVDREDFESRKEEFDNWTAGCLETAGHGLAVLWAQTAGEDIGDGMGTGDALEESKLEPLVEKMITERTSKNWKGFKAGDRCTPDTALLAKRFVHRNFKDYLKLSDDAEADRQAGIRELVKQLHLL